MAEPYPAPAEVLDPKTRFPRWLRWTAFAAVLVGAAVISWHVVDAKARRELAAARAVFGAHGFPMRLEEIIPPPVPDVENADGPLREAWRIVSGTTAWEKSSVAGVFSEIFELNFNAKPIGSSSPLINFTATPIASSSPLLEPATLEKLVRLASDPAVTRFAAQLELAIQRPTWRCGLDYTEGPALLTPHIGPARFMVRLLMLHALALAQEPGTADAAWEEVRVAEVLAERVEHEPLLLTHLTAVACRGIIRASLVDMLESAVPWPELTPIIDRQVQSLATARANFQDAMHAERLVMHSWTEDFVARRKNWLSDVMQFGGGPRWLRWSDPWLTPVLSPLARPRLCMELRACLELQLEAALALQGAEPEIVGRLDAVARRAAASQWIFPKFVFPDVESFGGAHVTDLTQRRAFVVLLATLRHRQRNGAWPVNVSELGLPAEVVMDACSGTELALHVEADAVAVYGRGFDGDDDGGQAESSPNWSTSDGDIVVRVRLRPNPAE